MCEIIVSRCRARPGRTFPRRVLWPLVVLLGMAGTLRADEAPPPAGEASAPPGEIDLRPAFAELGLGPRRQGGRPTCSVFTVAGALEFALGRGAAKAEPLSVEFLNWATDQARRRQRDGGFFSEIWEGYSQHGICPETAMPYTRKRDPDRAPDAGTIEAARQALACDLEVRWIKKWNARTGLSEAQLAGIKEALAEGWPVCGGFRWPNRPRWEEGLLQMCAPSEVFDGHSVLLVVYRDDPDRPGGGSFVIRDSNSGEDRSMPYAYAQAFMNDALWIPPAKRPAPAVADEQPAPGG